MRVTHNSKSGKTTITLDWTETKQVRSNLGLDVIRDAVNEAYELSVDDSVNVTVVKEQTNETNENH